MTNPIYRVREKDIQKTILDYLAVHHIFHYRNNTGKFVGEYKGKKRIASFGVKGAPDIICVLRGRFIGIEVKAEKGDQSRDQYAFQVSLEKAGGAYILAHSVDDVIKFFVEAA